MLYASLCRAAGIWVGESLTPTLAPPASILAAATFPPRADRRRACGLWPDMPQVEIGPKDALVHVEEELDAQPGRLPLRPRRFRLLEQVRRPGFDEPVRSVFPVPLPQPARHRGRVLLVSRPRAADAPRRRWRASAPCGGCGASCSGRSRGSASGLRRRSVTFWFLRPEAIRTPCSSCRSWPESAAAGVDAGCARYWTEVRGPRAFACVIEHDAGFGDGLPGARLRAKLDPSRTKGLRWCRGRFRGVVKYRDGYGCPPRGRCRPPDDFPTEQRTAGPFAFTVQPCSTLCAKRTARAPSPTAPATRLVAPRANVARCEDAGPDRLEQVGLPVGPPPPASAPRIRRRRRRSGCSRPRRGRASRARPRCTAPRRSSRIPPTP